MAQLPTDSAADPLRRAAEVMDRLRSPGGCPWDAAQTSRSLTPYLIEETYELLEAIETDDAQLLREELGDLLLQVLFHARISEELPGGRAFGIDDVADDLVGKLVRRHPHVFAATPASPASVPPAELSGAELDDVWERQKAAEKGRRSAVDGVPLNQPALALAAKLVARARRAGVDTAATAAVESAATAAVESAATAAVESAATAAVESAATAAVESAATAAVESAPADEQVTEALFGAELMRTVARAVDAGVDPESALRRAAREYREGILAAERTRPS